MTDLIDDRALAPLTDKLAAEDALLEAVARGARRDTLLLWSAHPALSVTSKETRLPGYAQACAHFAALGAPVAVRRTGGTVVPQGPGTLNVAWIAAADGSDIRAGFATLCAMLVAALARLGVAAQVGALPGAYCDGDFNLLVGARKLAGTAQRRIRRPGGPAGGAVLAHAAVLVNDRPAAIEAQVNAFYSRAGSPDRVSAGTTTCLADHVAGEAMPALRAALEPDRFD